MLSKTITIQGLSIQEFKQEMREMFRIELQIFAKSFLKNSECEFLNRKQTALMLQIEVSTLSRWTESGKLTPKKVGRKLYYEKSEIEKLLKLN